MLSQQERRRRHQLQTDCNGKLTEDHVPLCQRFLDTPVSFIYATHPTPRLISLSRYIFPIYM